jgi:hypothetical protein
VAVKKSPAEIQLAGFLAKFTPEMAALAEAVLRKMRARLPGAMELVYDNYNALVIGFGPSERASEAMFSIAVYPRWVNLFFLEGVALPDPHKILKGAGKQVRSIMIKDAAELDKPAVRALMTAALKNADKPLDPKARPQTVIRAVAAKQRPRRPAGG